MPGVKAGSLLFVRGNGLFSKAIRQAAGGHWNHVEILLDPTTSVGAMEGQGIRSCQFAKEFEHEEWQICKVQTQDSIAKDVADEALSMVGNTYDVRALAGVWAKFILKRLGIKIKTNPQNQQTSFFCSELVGHLWLKKGIKFTDDEPSLLSPSEIFESPLVQMIQGATHGGMK